MRFAGLIVVVASSVLACNYVVGYDKLRKVNRPVKLLPDGAVAILATDVALGAKHTCATYDDATLRCWGDNEAGQLGVGGATNRLVPTLVPDLGEITSLSLGERHTCVTVVGGETWCWGANDHGQLGIGSADLQVHERPVRVLASPAERVHAGRLHTCVETFARTTECFGANERGALGDGNLEASRALPEATLGEGWEKIATNGEHTCGIQDGAVQCLGRNDAGQLGLGHTVDTSAPEPTRL